jgi:hypothetical protein
MLLGFIPLDGPFRIFSAGQGGERGPRPGRGLRERGGGRSIRCHAAAPAPYPFRLRRSWQQEKVRLVVTLFIVTGFIHTVVLVGLSVPALYNITYFTDRQPFCSRADAAPELSAEELEIKRRRKLEVILA